MTKYIPSKVYVTATVPKTETE
uniref:Uncharacterized protein n=1 Tax=Arundo donax TaxID=35708 RepID=A0A0A9HAH0_ARUDO